MWSVKDKEKLRILSRFELTNGSDIPDTEEFVSHKDNCNVVIGWMRVEEIQNVIIYPEFLKKEIIDLSGAIKHFVTKC